MVPTKTTKHNPTDDFVLRAVLPTHCTTRQRAILCLLTYLNKCHYLYIRTVLPKQPFLSSFQVNFHFFDVTNNIVFTMLTKVYPQSLKIHIQSVA
jgi:hypothetical protein